jgi:hypothetical protein
MVWPYARRTPATLLHTTSRGVAVPAWASKTEPSPICAQSTRRGSGAHGTWLVTRSISAMTAGRAGLP